MVVVVIVVAVVSKEESWATEGLINKSLSNFPNTKQEKYSNRIEKREQKAQTCYVYLLLIFPLRISCEKKNEGEQIDLVFILLENETLKIIVENKKSLLFSNTIFS